MNVFNGSRPKSLARSPERPARRESSSASRPAPAAQVAVNAVMQVGRTGRRRLSPQCAARRASFHAMLFDVRGEIGQRGEDAAIVLVVGTQLEAITLRDLQRELERVDGVEAESRAEQRLRGIYLLGRDRLQVERRDDHRSDVALQG